MKKILTFAVLSVIILFAVFISCRKSSEDPGCGCNTDSVWHYAYYNNFGGYSSYNANLIFDSIQKSWFITVSIPNTNFGASLKVCNTDLAAVKSIIDKGGGSILFSGKLKRLCPNDNFGMTLPEILNGYIVIDSLKKIK